MQGYLLHKFYRLQMRQLAAKLDARREATKQQVLESTGDLV